MLFTFKLLCVDINCYIEEAEFFIIVLVLKNKDT